MLSALSYDQVLETVSSAGDVDEEIGTEETKKKENKLNAELCKEEASKFMAANNIKMNEGSLSDRINKRAIENIDIR